MVKLKLLTLRKQKGLTQKQVADEIGMTVPCYCKIEYNQTFPRPENLEKLAKAFDCKVGELFEE